MHCPVCGLWVPKDDAGFIHCVPCNWRGNEAVRLVDVPATVADLVDDEPLVIDDRPKKKGK